MKKILVILVALAMICASLVGCNASKPGDLDQSDLALIEQAGKIVVGVTRYEPMDYLDDETGEWVGFDAELAQMFAEELGVNCQLVIIPWSNKVAELDGRQIDLVWNGMTATDELGKKIDFSISYAKNAQVVIVKKGSTLTAEGLKDAKIAVETGSAGASVAAETVKATNITKVTAMVDALNEVLAGTSDAAIIDLTMAESVIGKGNYAELQMVDGLRYGEEVFAVGMRKGSDIKAKLDAFLKEKYADGTMAGLIEKYQVVLNEETLK